MTHPIIRKQQYWNEREQHLKPIQATSQSFSVIERNQSFSVIERNLRRPPPSAHRKYNHRMMIREDREGIISEAIIQSVPDFPDFKNEYINVSPLKGLAQQKFGDYTCTNILTMWERLRRFDPYFLDRGTSQDIAQKVLEALQKNLENKMITKLRRHDAGFLTFKLSREWMFERIQEMLAVGIDLWAPVMGAKLIVIDGPELVTGQDLHAEEFRSSYIREMLMRMLDYSGITVSTGLLSNKKNRTALKTYFTQEPDQEITSIKHRTPLFAGNSEILAMKFRADLRALWSSIYELKAQSIVYVTSVRELEYVWKCFDVARNEGWLSVGWNPVVSCAGYRTSSDERQKLAHLWTMFENRTNPKVASLVELGKAAGYTPEASMECAIKYTYLKTHRLAECTLNIDEMLDEEGNTFVYLLKTRDLISLLCENSGGGGIKHTIATCREEHELAVHLVQFTEVIEDACFTFLLHPVCDYLWDLCKKFRSYYSKAMGFLDMRNSFLCDATRVVMDQCFHLLRFTRSLSRRYSGVILREEMAGVEAIPWPVSVARPKDINPRFEMFCMNVCVADNSFGMGSIHGIVSLVDTDGLLSDGRLPLNKKQNGHVAYFYREWYESIGICDNGYVYFETPSPSHLVPFSSDLEIFVKLFVTTNDKCFLMCLSQQSIDLSEMWADADTPPSYICRTLRYDSDNGCTLINYIALRDAVDLTMTLRFKSPNKQYVYGHIFASYGNILDDLDVFRRSFYKAIIFEAGEDGRELEDGPLSLQKSVMAVPVEGSLVLEGRFSDKTGTVICNEKHTLDALTEGNNELRFNLNGEDCYLKLEVKWSQGPKSSYC